MISLHGAIMNPRSAIKRSPEMPGSADTQYDDVQRLQLARGVHALLNLSYRTRKGPDMTAFPRAIARNAALRLLPSYRRVSTALALSNIEKQQMRARIKQLTAALAQSEAKVAPPAPLQIKVSRGERSWLMNPDLFEVFQFQNGDKISVIASAETGNMPVTWGDTNIEISSGRSIRVPAKYEFFEFRGFRIPAHLIALTGAGGETLDSIGRAHIRLYEKFCGLAPDMTILDVGCGIGRDAMQLLDFLDDKGRYIGIDVTRDSILWCQDNITTRHPAFEFHHFDAENELYNPHGRKTSMDFTLPVANGSVDRIVLASVFTHLFHDEALHYMREFARVLKPSGLIYASFFLYTEEAIAAARKTHRTSFLATFEHPLSDGVFSNDAAYPRGAVAFTDAAMSRLILASGLRLVRPYLKGWWSGMHAEADDGQDVAILARADAL